MKHFMLLMLALGLLGCPLDTGTAMNAVQDEGYVNITIGEQNYIFNQCPEDQPMNRRFTATRRVEGNDDRSVAGIVCCGHWGSCMVRTVR